MTNTLTIVGNLGSDPELKYTPAGKAVITISVGDTPRRLNRDTNTWEDAGETLWMRCELWGEDAEEVAQRLHKGSRVRVTGRLSQRSYETREGDKRTVMELKADDIAEVIRAPRKGASGGGRTTSKPMQDDPWGAIPPANDSEAPF